MLLLEELRVQFNKVQYVLESLTTSSAEKNKMYTADIRSNQYPTQGKPKDIYSLINHYTDAKDIWENVKMILEGSELTKDDRESQLYDEYEHFRQIKGEGIQGYYVRSTNTDPLALVSDASAQQYPTQSSKSPNSTEPYPSDNFQMNSGSSSTENLIETSSNARNKAMVQDGKVVVQDVRGRYNATNQGRPFQRNNARGNGVAGNVGASEQMDE
ncbi:hypothetical protein Tco_0607986 [Tanacetum coccineum]